MQLQIDITGAGIGGLSVDIALGRLGHSLTVYEAASVLTKIGAGIQLTPNASKILLRWVRRWRDGKLIGHMDTPTYNTTFGGPYVQLYRADLQQALLKVANNLGVVILRNSRVTEYDFECPALILKDGQTIIKDFIVAADGSKSIARSKIRASTDESTIPTGLAVFRAAIHASRVAAIPELSHIVSDAGVNLWIGPQRHAVAYAMSGDSLVNVVLEFPESRPSDEWTSAEYLSDISNLYHGWDPSLLKILSMIRSPLKWSLQFSVPLQTWSSESGKVVLMGDAAHIVPSFLAQGAAMAIEDAALLATLFSTALTEADLPKIPPKFQEVRMSRKMKVQELSLRNLRLYHLQDGDEQVQRDDPHNTSVEYSPIWNSAEDQAWLYGYDAATTANSSTSVIDLNRIDNE